MSVGGQAVVGLPSEAATPPSQGPPLSSLTPRSPRNSSLHGQELKDRREALPQSRQQGTRPHQGVAVEVRTLEFSEGGTSKSF